MLNTVQRSGQLLPEHQLSATNLVSEHSPEINTHISSWNRFRRSFLRIKVAAPPSSLQVAAAAVRRRRPSSPEIVSGQFDMENPFVLISSVLLVQADEGVSFLVMDRIGDFYRNLPRRADVIVTTVGARHKCQQAVFSVLPLPSRGADPDPQQWYQSQCFSDLINTDCPIVSNISNFRSEKSKSLNQGPRHRRMRRRNTSARWRARRSTRPCMIANRWMPPRAKCRTPSPALCTGCATCREWTRESRPLDCATGCRKAAPFRARACAIVALHRPLSSAIVAPLCAAGRPMNSHGRALLDAQLHVQIVGASRGCAALVAAVRGLAPRAIFMVAAVAGSRLPVIVRRCRDGRFLLGFSSGLSRAAREVIGPIFDIGPVLVDFEILRFLGPKLLLPNMIQLK
ncbi:hypothetical protein F511_23955 [Dorcoceras hygrometricum]|uniref:Uncharacterized protein n=1 Tax=Dorcoceras hygrometricum TaxID=472368 RepID=A0A2Z7CU28_9LAMI|nr:hypothetical protein F511_23955 [Dorcoceras hygrometricum]